MFSLHVFQTQCVFDAASTAEFRPAAFQVLESLLWLMVTLGDRAGLHLDPRRVRPDLGAEVSQP